MTAASLTSLPPEILYNVTAYLTHQDRSQLLATCQQIRNTLSAITWRHLVVARPSLPPTAGSSSSGGGGTCATSSSSMRHVTGRQPFFVQRLGDPIDLSSFKGAVPRTVQVGHARFGEFCQAVFRGYYNSVFEWVESLVVNIALRKQDFDELLLVSSEQQFNELSPDQLVYWFLTNYAPLCVNLKVIQIDARLDAEVETLEHTFLPRFLRDCAACRQQVNITGSSRQRIDLASRRDGSALSVGDRIELIRVSPFRETVSTKNDPTATSPMLPRAKNQWLTRIPDNLRRLDLDFDLSTELTSAQLATLFKDSAVLYSLTLNNVKLLDNDTPWFPQSVVELSLQETSTPDYFLIPEQVSPNVQFLHLYSDGLAGLLHGQRMEQFQVSFPNLNNLYIEKFKIGLDFMDYLNPLLLKLRKFSCMSVGGFYFEDFDVRAILSMGLDSVMLGQCYISTVELLETLDVPRKLGILRLRPSVGYDERAQTIFARTVKALAQFTTRLQLDMYHYRWQNTEMITKNELLHPIDTAHADLVASRGNTGHYLFEVDLEMLWRKGWSALGVEEP